MAGISFNVFRTSVPIAHLGSPHCGHTRSFPERRCSTTSPGCYPASHPSRFQTASGYGLPPGGLLRPRRGSIRPRLVEQQAQLAIQLPLALHAGISAKHTSFSAVRSAGTLRLYFARWLRCLILAVLAPLCLPPKIYPPASSAMYDSRVHGTLFELYCIFSHPVFLCKTLGDLTLTVIPSLNQQFMRLIM